MGKKKGKRSGGRRASDKIALESAVDEDVMDGVTGDLDILDDLDREELEEEVALRQKLDRGRRANAYAEENQVFAISDSDSDDDFADPEVAMKRMKKKKKKTTNESKDQDDFASDLDESGAPTKYEDELIGGEGWGSRKKHFYGGNPNEPDGKAVLDGDERDEAEIEEEETHKLQERQLQEMDESDFVDVFAVQEEASKNKKKKSATKADSTTVLLDLSRMSRKERARQFAAEAPEFGPIAADFAAKLHHAEEKLAPVIRLMEEGKLPAEGKAADFIRTKLQVVLNYCVNICCYIAFKAKRASLRHHPITGRLVEYKQLLDKIEKAEKPIMEQVEELLEEIKAGKTPEELARKAKKRVVKAAQKERNKSKKLRVLSDPEVNEQKREGGSQGSIDLAQFTLDEAKALQMYEASKRKRKHREDDDEEESDEEELPPADIDNGQDADERRKITREIEKNKGLTPKRSKLQRNPRVKHRVKFHKAKIARKGQIREARTEVKKYGGELSGINARVKKGIKLA